MPITPITVQVDEVIGEDSDPNEANLKLTVQKTALTTIDVHAPFFATAFPEFGFVALSAAGTGTEVDLQETTGETADPSESEVEVVVPKSLFTTVPDIHADMEAFTTGSALILPA